MARQQRLAQQHLFGVRRQDEDPWAAGRAAEALASLRRCPPRSIRRALQLAETLDCHLHTMTGSNRLLHISACPLHALYPPPNCAPGV